MNGESAICRRRTSRRLALAAFLCVLAARPIGMRAQEFQPLLAPEIRDLLHESLSGERAKDHVIRLTRWSRVQGSRQYREAARYVLSELRSHGFDDSDAFIESFPSDGRVRYQTWQSPPGFDMTWAELRMVEPRQQRLVGYPEVAMSLMTYSNPGDVTAGLVWVGRGTSEADYAGKNLRGKIALATGYGGDVHRLAVLALGAAAVVCYLDDDRAREHPDMLQYTGLWPRTSELERVAFGFNLTNRQGRMLRDLVESGEPVVLHARAEGIGLEPFFMDVPVASIRGAQKPEEVLLVSAHLDLPKESANDNASGSAAALDMAQTLLRLVRNGRLPRPRRTIRFVWVPEFFGTMAYLDRHPEVAGPAYGGSYLANLNLDMVGENEERLHSRATFSRTPDSIPSVLNDVVANMVEMVSRMNVRTPRGSRSTFHAVVTPFVPGSDHQVFIDRRIPAMMFGHEPDYTHHTSEDTPDKVDPVELEREEIIAAGTLIFLADLDEEQAADLAALAGAGAAHRLGLASRRAMRQVAAASGKELGPAWATAQNLLDHAYQVGRATLADVRHFQAKTGTAIDTGLAALDAQHAVFRDALRRSAHRRGAAGSIPPPLPSVSSRIPVRTTRGPIWDTYLEVEADDDERAWLSDPANPVRGNVRFELHNLMDGRTTLDAIHNILSAEFGPVAGEAVRRHVRLLSRLGLVTWRSDPAADH
ncbi:MAG: DUF4910 domain-containing protein [Acidobacteriota bacterium]